MLFYLMTSGYILKHQRNRHRFKPCLFVYRGFGPFCALDSFGELMVNLGQNNVCKRIKYIGLQRKPITLK